MPQVSRNQTPRWALPRRLLAPGKDVRAVEDALMKRVPTEFLMDAHHWLILHGRYVCKAQKPDCALCVVRDLCRFRLK